MARNSGARRCSAGFINAQWNGALTYVGVGPNKNGDKVLQQLAEETGGRVFFPFKVEDLEDAFQQISKELRTQYNLGYFSTNAARDGAYRKIEVRLGEKGLKTRYRRGYYAPTS